MYIYFLLSSAGNDGSWSSDALPLPHSSEKTCVPLVFYTKNVWKPSGNGKDIIGIQVCLVEEQCKGLIDVR